MPQVERLIRNTLADEEGIVEVVIDLGAVGRLDYTGAAVLARFVSEVRASGTTISIVNAKPGATRAIEAHQAELDDG